MSIFFICKRFFLIVLLREKIQNIYIIDRYIDRQIDTYMHTCIYKEIHTHMHAHAHIHTYVRVLSNSAKRGIDATEMTKVSIFTIRRVIVQP